MRCDQATAMRRNASSRVGQTAAFEDARAVATCEDSNGATLLAVADLGKHQVRLLGLRGLSVVSTRVLGTGVPGHVSGAINSASFYEPLALVYADKILYVGCYGGEHHGTVSAVTPTAFAVRTLGALSKAYNAIGYVPSSATAEQRAHRHPPVREAVRDLGEGIGWVHSPIPASRALRRRGALRAGLVDLAAFDGRCETKEACGAASSPPARPLLPVGQWVARKSVGEGTLKCGGVSHHTLSSSVYSSV